MKQSEEITVTLSLNEWELIRTSLHSRGSQWLQDESEKWEDRRDMYEFFKRLSLKVDEQLGKDKE